MRLISANYHENRNNLIKINHFSHVTRVIIRRFHADIAKFQAIDAVDKLRFGRTAAQLAIFCRHIPATFKTTRQFRGAISPKSPLVCPLHVLLSPRLHSILRTMRTRSCPLGGRVTEYEYVRRRQADQTDRAKGSTVRNAKGQQACRQRRQGRVQVYRLGFDLSRFTK